MQILDRYLLRHFLQILVICFLSLMGLYVMIDAFGHIDSFSEYSQTHGSLIGVIGEYYGYQSLRFFDRASGPLAMIAAMFTAAWLQRHQELTALMAAGISKVRVIRPLLVAAVVVSLLGVANRELLIPRFRQQLSRDTKNLGAENARAMEARFDNSTGILIGGDLVLAVKRQILHPTIVLSAKLSQHGRQIVAERATWVDATVDHPTGYLLEEVSIPESIDSLKSLLLEERAVIVTPRDAAWLEAGQAFVVSDVPFELLSSGSAWRSFASTLELIAELGSPSTDLGPEVQVAIHSRLVQPMMDGTLLMIGLPLVFSRRNRNLFLSIGLCLIITLVFTLVALACQSLGSLGLLRPTLCAWLPLMLFVPLAVAMSHTLRT